MQFSEWMQCVLSETTAALEGVQEGDAEKAVAMILSAPRVFVLGLGRSGLILRMFAMRLMQIGLRAYVVGDATTPAIGAGDLLIVLSGSGRTETVLLLARKAKDYGARVLAITGRSEAPLAQLADMRLVLPVSSPKAASPEGDRAAYSRLPLADAFEQAASICLICIGAMLAAQCGQDNAAMMQRHANLE
ncbi:MAG: 6-phospho-3-hexuloisomerase [Caldilinea sp.]|jgi:6-phospho-3-hexuloisomerase|uniref:Putative 6-phospho-3-hexuloisomerase n=1 Tax=Caldilinea aerophila (strain DSM 14535 / JCM 11387 / NBRC 104270 / STL-6-O1) TaxID=926550 RepID=I0I0E4_CALAS|nr:putative 6-phospho-3-hexuloisomerase [Caldilinea aerophila DSM 14535 = NBRC 104270]GIV74682.1 MAG: 6-phospho-3-hexuloisomerase [Caldilinea sp.]